MNFSNDDYSSGFYYCMFGSEELCKKFKVILADRTYSSKHRKILSDYVVGKLCAVPCYSFMDMEPFEKAMLVAQGVHCEVFYADGVCSIIGYTPITENHAQIIVKAGYWKDSRVSPRCYNYIINDAMLAGMKDPEKAKTFAYYRKRGLL
jgi:hypothetical protein